MSKADVKFPSAPDTSAIDIQDEGSVIVSNPTALNFTGPGVTVTENPSGTAEVDIPGLQYWTESEDAATQQSTIFTPNNGATDVNAVLLPKGNGANLAQTPDGTTTGGNARGQYATDWQKSRNQNFQVASGNFSTVSGGRQNQAAGNSATVVGGFSNSGAGNNSVAGGVACTASGTAAIYLGSEGTVSGNNAVATGRRCIVSGAQASATTGGNEAQGTHSRATGGGALVKNAYTRAWAAGFGNAAGQGLNFFSGRSQEGVMIGGYDSRLTASGVSPQQQASGSLIYLRPGSGINQVGITSLWISATSNQQFSFQIKMFATVVNITGTATGINIGDVKQWNFEGSGKIVAGTVTILNATTIPVIIYEDTGLSTMSARFIVGSSNSVGVEVTNATFAGGGTLELILNGYLYYQEAAIN